MTAPKLHEENAQLRVETFEGQPAIVVRSVFDKQTHVMTKEHAKAIALALWKAAQ